MYKHPVTYPSHCSFNKFIWSLNVIQKLTNARSPSQLQWTRGSEDGGYPQFFYHEIQETMKSSDLTAMVTSGSPWIPHAFRGGTRIWVCLMFFSAGMMQNAGLIHLTLI